MKITVSGIFPAPSTSSTPLSLLVSDVTHKPPLPVPLKFGDANQDGFPDILAILVSGTGSSIQKTPYLAYSVQCHKGVAGCDGNGNGRRGWSVLKKGGEALRGIKDARGIAFVDMDEDVSELSPNFLHPAHHTTGNT